MMNNRYELVKKIMNKLDSLPSSSPNSHEFDYQKYVKEYLSDITGIKFFYDDTGNYRLKLQKFYGKKSPKLKRYFEGLGLNINMKDREHRQTIDELEIDITNFLILKYLNLFSQ